MKKRLFSLLFALSSLTFSHAAGPKDLPFGSDPVREPKIFVNNRILTTINGKPISAYDLMKKMDVSFYREYPEYTSSVDARYQYYQMAWKHTLNEIIDKELVLSDAKESKIEVSSGDVRQEMESSFGPNIISNLNKVDLTFDEAAKIIKDEIIMRRMTSGRVHAKAIRDVTPAKIRAAYDAFIADPANAAPAEWSYRVVTIGGASPESLKEAADTAYRLLLSGISLDNLVKTLNDGQAIPPKAKVTVSSPIKHKEKDLSPDYAKILTSLDKGMYSQPSSHKNRNTKATVYRIFFIEEKIPGGFLSYKEMEARIKNRLLENAVDEETDAYLLKLRKHYHISESEIEAGLPPNYEPFVLK